MGIGEAMRLLFGAGFAAILVAVVSASAEDHGAQDSVRAATPAAAASQPPGRVGQVSLVSGKVGFRSPGDTVWSDAEINDPISGGVSLRTDPQARAVMRFGPDTIALAEDTEISIANLSDTAVEIAVSRGRIDVDVPQLSGGENIQIDFPRGGVWPLQPGRYDINTGGGNQPPWVAAYSGGARFVGGGADIPIKAGYRVLFGASIATEPVDDDEFAVWSADRAIDETRLAAPYFLSPAMTGSAALDAAGTWRADGKYGEVWVPNALPAEWAPYRFGHWRWLAPWGWSWIDDQPWGFAASHYGRWAFLDRHWIWVPGAYTAHPVFAPAVVAFLGTPGVGLSYAEGFGPAVAWFPLAPGEVYWPGYTNDLDYIRSLNAGNIGDLGIVRLRADGEPPAEIVNGHFANRQFASVVPRPAFTAGQGVAPALLQLPLERLLNAPAIMGSPQIGPPAPAAPARIAAAPATAGQSAVTHVAARAPESSSWAKAVYSATIRSHNYVRAARMRSAHLRVPGYAAAPRPRHEIILRVAHATRIPTSGEAHKRVIR
jgi:hypothetical protein